MDWSKLLWAMAIIGMIALIAPRAISMLKDPDRPKGSQQEWLNVSFLIGCVVAFVLLLVMIVR